MNMRLMSPQTQTQTPASEALGALMSRVALRDQAAFKQLYDATACCLLGIAVRMLHDRCWAEEVLQEVYVSVWHAAPNYSPAKAQPMTWLMAIARNKALDALRSSRADRTHCVRPTAAADDDEEGAGLPDIADACAGPLEQLVNAVDAQQLRCCLQRLEPQQRQAIALAFYDGLTHAELALHLRQPLGTVKAWVRRGLDRLKRCLEPHELPSPRTA
jgi:RNA polymerase sigma factor (sigma-70 family)